MVVMERPPLHNTKMQRQHSNLHNRTKQDATQEEHSTHHEATLEDADERQANRYAVISFFRPIMGYRIRPRLSSTTHHMPYWLFLLYFNFIYNLSRFLLTSLLMSDPPGPPETDIWMDAIQERRKTTSPLLGL